LRYFVAVAEAGHLTRAAARLNIQQPPLSQQIKALENHLGMVLFRRHSKGMALTESGEFFLEEARRIVDSIAATEQRMARVAKGVRGRLAIAFTTSAAAHLLTPRVLRVFRGRYPEIELSSPKQRSRDHRAIASGTSIAVFWGASLGARRVAPTLLREPVLVAAPLDHRLAQKPRAGKNAVVALKDFQGENLILVRRSGAPGLYANLLALCAERGIYPNIVAEVDRMMTNLNMVAAGQGFRRSSFDAARAPKTVAYRLLGEKHPSECPLTLCIAPPIAPARLLFS
jgi:DNA-binding transcriptional LysR family regulator